MTGDGRDPGFAAPPGWDGWAGPSGDPNDEQFGDVVAPATLDDAGGYDAVLVGEPYEGGNMGESGAREGPDALRAALAATKTHAVGTGPVAATVGDLGDVAALRDRPAVDDEPVTAVQERVRAVAERVHAADAFPVFLGGDNTLSYPNAAPLVDRGLGVVNLDAHLDVRAVRGDATRGTPYRQLFEAGMDAYACVGARHFETSTPYHEFVRERGGAVLASDEVAADPDAAADRALGAMDGVEAVYVSVDLDVVDAPAAPGVSAPTPGGIASRELFRLLRRLAADDRVAGFEVVEYTPRLDRGDRTGLVGARAVAHVLAGAFGGRDGPEGGGQDGGERDGDAGGGEER
jgi:formimidoylglutamase